MNKVLQSAGRVIRTEDDRGIILLLDDRFQNRQYQQLFPREWKEYEVCGRKEIKEKMEEKNYRLIEAVAEQLAEEILLFDEKIRKVMVEVKKPWAPVGLPLETVSVKIERCWNEAFIALGSNMGDKKKYIENAVEELKNEKLCRVLKVSKLIGTEPYGVTDQDEFLNGALKMETLLTPHELLELLHRIEQEAGRKRIRRWGPRTLAVSYTHLTLPTIA